MNLDERKRKILSTVVENYIESAEPVASKIIAEKYEREFSSATIRNEMKQLEEIGLLEQPHVSAGRIPSTMGYRYYIDNLMKENILTMMDIDYINNNIVSFGNVEATLENAVAVISKILKLPAVLHTKNKDTIENVKILKVSERILLIILMSKGGTVKDVIVKITDAVPEDSLEELDKMLNKSLKGTFLEDLPDVLSSAISNQLHKFSDILEALALSINYEIKENKTSAVKTDMIELLEIPEFSDTNRVKELLNILSTKQIIGEVIEKIEDKDISIVIGNESKDILLKDYSIISLDMETTTNAKVAVLGPKRTDYSKAISTLKYVNNKLKNIFSKEEDNIDG
ncbi:MAG: heat-inducible transcriptional repressor HrcA [Clostridia bacterium]|nr:heat-inducible transcriptional repressor HrcA [Clostridia bacterium]MDD4375369.1 heat-inducible transcriptional repressor HrcA [Clostridia bacterium]